MRPRRPWLAVLTLGLSTAFSVGTGEAFVAHESSLAILFACLAFVCGFVNGRWAL